MKLCFLYFAKCFYSHCFSLRYWGSGPSPGVGGGVSDPCQIPPRQTVALSAGSTTFSSVGGRLAVKEQTDRNSPLHPFPGLSQQIPQSWGLPWAPSVTGIEDLGPGSSPHTVPSLPQHRGEAAGPLWDE